MNKAQSKYQNTALLMDQALLLILEKKDLEFITIKEICAKAGVNRSTFYLHYENINDLFKETIEYLNKDFLSSFKNGIGNQQPEDMVFIRKEFIIPYLEFVKKNKRAMQIIHSKPFIFNNENIYNNMKNEVFIPAIKKHNVPKGEQGYIIEFFTKWVVSIVGLWLKNNCEDTIDHIVDVILKCVRF